jgi:enoyl-[acyl-carrier-protein] reductase (NADH)
MNCISAAAVKGDGFIRVITGRANTLGIPFEAALKKEMVSYSLLRPAGEYELANCAVFVASDESSVITGQTIVNHCGQHISFK